MQIITDISLLYLWSVPFYAPPGILQFMFVYNQPTVLLLVFIVCVRRN